jgi:hypothetical protein
MGPSPDAPFEVHLHGEQLPAGLRNDGGLCFAIAPIGVLARCKAFCRALEVPVDRWENPVVRDCVHDLLIQSETGPLATTPLGTSWRCLDSSPR